MRVAGAPALLVPDEQAWAALGVDTAAEGLEPVLDAGRAERVLLADPLPRELAEALAARLDDAPARAIRERRAAALPGVALTEALAGGHRGHEAAHGGRGEEHGGHEDMMAITGEPSADGLVMEPLELTLGPLATPLPAGLIAELVLDGDVVARCTLRATLRSESPGRSRAGSPTPPDMLAPRAWGAAIAAAAGEPRTWLRVAAVELERAVSHLAWARALGRLLGFAPLVDGAAAALGPALAAREPLLVGPVRATVAGDLLAAAARAAAALHDRCARSRALATRTRGLAPLDAAQAAAAGVEGPAARAAGAGADARAAEPLYGELGFAPAARAEGDALARTLVRLDEARAALALAAGALARGTGAARLPQETGEPEPAVVEGPRGTLRAERRAGGWLLDAPGEGPLLAVAGRAAIGLEWASALAAIASFDPSPWSVGR